FMEAVEATTAGLPKAGDAGEAEAADASGARREFNGKPSRPAGQQAASNKTADAWAGLLRAGAALLQQMSTATSTGTNGANGSARQRNAGLIRTDAETGEPYLRLPVPSPDVVRQVMDALGAFLGGNRG